MWVQITPDDVIANLSKGEFDAYSTKQLGGNVSDPLVTIIPDVLSEVRGYVLTRHTLESTGIPRGLRNAAIDLVIYRLSKRIQSESTPSRKAAADEAYSLLQKVADGKLAIESATDDSGSATSDLPAPQLTDRELVMSRDNQDGI